MADTGDKQKSHYETPEPYRHQAIPCPIPEKMWFMLCGTPNHVRGGEQRKPLRPTDGASVGASMESVPFGESCVTNKSHPPFPSGRVLNANAAPLPIQEELRRQIVFPR